jgi:protoporphyrinogen oxidase
MNHQATELRFTKGQVSSVLVSSADGTEDMAADHVISTMPLRTLVRSIRPAAPPEALASAEGLSYRDFLVVALMLRREKIFPDNWIYIHTPGVRVGRIQNFNNWSAAMVPEKGITCLGMEYFCFKGDGLWNSTDEQLGKLAATELASLGLGRAEDVIDSRVVRVPKAYPIYNSVYRDHITRVRAFIDPIPNLHTVGRNGMHKYNNQDHSMLTAMMAVDNMLGASYDVWTVNTDFDYHEEQRLDEDASNEAPADDPSEAAS